MARLGTGMPEDGPEGTLGKEGLFSQERSGNLKELGRGRRMESQGSQREWLRESL